MLLSTLESTQYNLRTTADLSEESEQTASADVVATEQVVSELLHGGRVQGLVARKESCKPTEGGTVRSSVADVAADFVHRQGVAAVNLAARRTT